ncbi:oligopeptide ABC transporter, periplasmatic component [Paracholeplasma brassicae]|uniref:Oligopeptide ABC transporter, periplasmatic component n=1 Tax=Acholeplasma brassicae TaxID=61635 RepID=U4KS94_9MOLU|nr:ABC transporter substrate-binding protein [Paracholeplasma brassicae]CCV66418.1 oligopeptide ABC transporter, periplasmatic component [Paracholeplasma brassicae]
MKKVLLLLLVAVSAIGLAACGETTNTPGSGYDKNAVFRNYYSGGVYNINPYSETLADASTMYEYLTDSLYIGDFDWEKAIAEGLATEVGDFETSGAAALPYNRVPRMAAGEPVDVSGDGTKWQITLKEGLKFEDGTAITAETFNYSWRMLLDPLLLNDRASNLYSATDLPLKNAEYYFKQHKPDEDKLGFVTYEVSGVIYSRENSYLTTATDQPTWKLYAVETAVDNGIKGPAITETEYPGGPQYKTMYTEFWGGTDGKDGWVLVDKDDNPFLYDENNNLVAPEEGWTFADGTPIPHTGGVAKKYAGGLPAFMDNEGNRAVVEQNGLPVGGTQTFYNAVKDWSKVGFKVIDNLTFEIELAAAKTAWDVKGALLSGITGVVHPAKFEAGLNETKTSTTYGTKDNPLSSYGPYLLTTWQEDVVFIFTKNDNFHAADEYRIQTVRYDRIAEQSVAIDEFKAGRLDIVGASGSYYKDFKDAPGLRLSPTSTFFRFAFNIAERPDGTTNPILVYPEFRQAFYFAIDREEFTTEVRPPSLPTQAFLGPLYLSTEYNSTPYRGSEAGVGAVADFAPDTFGFNPVRAKELFDAAYAKAVADGNIVDGEKVSVEYTYYQVETNQLVADWVKSSVEEIFGASKFELKLTGVSSAALEQDWDNLDFDMTFGGWQGLTFDAPSLLGQVYNSSLAYMLEGGFDTANAEVTVELAATKAALESWVAAYDESKATDAQKAKHAKWVALLPEFEGNSLTTTYNKLFNYAYEEFYNVADVDYEGKRDDFDRITAALEGVLLDQMIAIPLFTTTSVTVYSTRVVLEVNEYHAWMGYGGLKYMYITK